MKEDTPLGWDQLRSSGHKDVTSLSVTSALRLLLYCAVHELTQHLHPLHNGMWGKHGGIGVLATIVVGTICLLWLTSAEESVDETVERGDRLLRQYKDRAKNLGEGKCLQTVPVLLIGVSSNYMDIIMFMKRTYAA